jgi:hypothetical protein
MTSRSARLIVAPALAAAALALVGCASAPGRVVIGIGNQAPLQDLFQKWLLIDDRQPLRELTGTVERVALNRGDPFDPSSTV